MAQVKNKKEASQRPGISRVVRRNVRTINKIRQETAHKRSLRERIADSITDFSGTMTFAILHAVWFAGWILLNTGRFGVEVFDPFPYGLLTMIVSLEAIFLATFVLISQNRMSQEDEDRAELDLQINLLTEHELTRVLKMLDEIQDKLGIENDHDTDLAELERETKPEDVLDEISRHQDHMAKKWDKRAWDDDFQ